MKYEDVLILNLMLNHDRRFLFHATNALQALCSSSGSEALLFFFYPFVTLIFLTRIPLTDYLSLVGILYSPLHIPS